MVVGAVDDNNKISCLYRIGPLTGSPEILTPQRATITSWGEGGGGGVAATYHTGEPLSRFQDDQEQKTNGIRQAGLGLLLHLLNL